MHGSRDISFVPSLHRASTDALIVHIIMCLGIYTLEMRSHATAQKCHYNATVDTHHT